MKTRRAVSWIAAAFAGVAILGTVSMPLAGQAAPGKPPVVDTAKKPAKDSSVKRIKIVKEEKTAGGEVCLPITCVNDKAAIDSAVAAERQAAALHEQKALIDQRRQDAARARNEVNRAIDQMEEAAEARRAARRADSIAKAEAEQVALKRHFARGFYFGAAAGASMPERDTRNGYTGGWNTTIPVGWDATDMPFGIRTDFTVDHMNGTRINNANNVLTAASGDITVWSMNVDLKLRAHAPGAPGRTNVYALGGLGAHRVVNGVYGTSGADAGKSLDFSAAKTNLGWNAGVGVSTAWGPTELFVESRFFQVKTNLPYHMSNGIGTYTAFTPIVIGLQWF